MPGQMVMNRGFVKNQDPEYVFRVDPSFFVNGDAHEFPTIQGALDWICTEVTIPAGQSALVNVAPALYEEQIHCSESVFIVGAPPTFPINEGKPTILSNTGADAAHYPLRGDDGDKYLIQNMTIHTAVSGIPVAGTFGKLSNSRFGQCRFEGGYFIEGTEDIPLYMTWNSCAFHNCKGFNLTGVAPNQRYLVLENMWLGWWHTATFESTHTVGYAALDMDGGHLASTGLHIKGDWYHFAKNYHSFGGLRTVYDTPNWVIYRAVTISDGIEFLQDPSITIFSNTNCNDGVDPPLAPDQPDIIASVPITNVEYSNNTQYNGIVGEIQTTNFVKNVGGDSINRYFSLADAMKSITGESAIILHEDLTNLPKLVMPATGSVLIDGGSLYGLSFAGDVVDLGLNDKLVIEKVVGINGGTINVDGNNAELHFHSCLCGTNIVQILASSGVGSFIHIKNTNLVAPAGCSVLQINSADPNYKITSSRLTGAVGQPAVEFTVDADGKLRSKGSTYLHGDGGANSPLIYTGAGKVDFSLYLCGFNAPWSAASFTNLIGSAGNVFDTGIDF